MKARIKKGDEVVVIAGDNRGARGKILNINRTTDRVLIEGVNLRKKHEKRTQDFEGGIVEREQPIHASNVMAAARYDSRHG